MVAIVCITNSGVFKTLGLGRIFEMVQDKKRVAVIITEYWDISHADVIITKMLEGFMLDGRPYTSTLDIVSMYVDQFPDNDMSREMASKHDIPIHDTIRGALLCGSQSFDLDGIILIGEHGEYPENEIGQILYPRRRFFEESVDVMLEFNKVIPVYSDKGYAVIKEDALWIYEQVKRHHIPFMSSSVVPFAPRQPIHTPFPNGAPLHKMFGFAYGSLERYTYHTLEMLQSIAENRAGGEQGIKKVRAFKDQDAIEKPFTDEWSKCYRSLGGFLNLENVDTFPQRLQDPVFFEVEYVDGLKAGILFIDSVTGVETGTQGFTSAYQVLEQENPICLAFHLQGSKPYIHFGRLVLEIEKFIHTSRAPYPVERSLLTTGGLDACMQALHKGEEVYTPHLHVVY